MEGIKEQSWKMSIQWRRRRGQSDPVQTSGGYQRLAEPSIYSFGAPTPVPSAQRTAGSLSIIAATRANRPCNTSRFFCLVWVDISAEDEDDRLSFLKGSDVFYLMSLVYQ